MKVGESTAKVPGYLSRKADDIPSLVTRMVEDMMVEDIC